MIDPEQPHEEETAEKEKAEAHILPKANIDRMVVASLPVATKTSMESKVILQYLASEFLAFIASEADSVSKTDKRRTTTGDDVLKAFRNLGLERYADSLEAFGKRAQLKSTSAALATGTSSSDERPLAPAKKPKTTSCMNAANAAAVSARTSVPTACVRASTDLDDAPSGDLALSGTTFTDLATAAQAPSPIDPQTRIERAFAELESFGLDDVSAAGELLIHELVSGLDDSFFHRFDEVHEDCGDEQQLLVPFL